MGDMTLGTALHAIRIACAITALLYAIAHPVVGQVPTALGRPVSGGP